MTRACTWLVTASLLVAPLVGRPLAHAQPGVAAPPVSDPARAVDVLSRANAAAARGAWPEVQRLLAGLAPESLAPADRAEVYRLSGLAAYFAGDMPTAERHFLEYLRADLDGRLDPALVPPDAVTFFEDVRARHSAELRAARPRRKRSRALAMVPTLAQLQNGERGKAIALGAGLGVLIGVNVTSYLLVRSWCNTADRVCVRDGRDYTDEARTWRGINIASAIGAVALTAYSVADGVYGYRRETHRLMLTGDGDYVGLSLTGDF